MQNTAGKESVRQEVVDSGYLFGNFLLLAGFPPNAWDENSFAGLRRLSFPSALSSVAL
jgi:hypothetical protein